MMINFSFSGSDWVVIDGSTNNYYSLAPQFKPLDKQLVVMTQVHKVHI